MARWMGLRVSISGIRWPRSDYRHQHHCRPADWNPSAGHRAGEAARTYTVLTVGDGLVTLIPSLLVSVAGGITLTRANSAGLLGARDTPTTVGEAGHTLRCQPGLRRDVPDSWSAQAGFFDRVGAAVFCRTPRGGTRGDSPPVEPGVAEKKKAGEAQSSI